MSNKHYTKFTKMIMMLHFENNFRGCKQILDDPWPKISKCQKFRTLGCKCLRHFWGIYGQIVVDLYLMRYKHLRAKQ